MATSRRVKVVSTAEMEKQTLVLLKTNDAHALVGR